MSLTVSYPIQVAKDDWEDIEYEIEDNEIVDWVLENKTKEEIIELMENGWDKKSDKEKQELINSYEYAGPDWFYKEGTKELNFEAIFDNDPQQSIEELVFEVLDEIEDDLIRDFKDEAEEDYEFSKLDDYTKRGISPSDFH